MKFVKGDKLKCISNVGLIGITIGLVYECINYTSCTDTVLIRNDNNIKDNYSSPHFIKL